MAKGMMMYEKFKIMDNLLKTMNTHISAEVSLISSMTTASNIIRGMSTVPSNNGITRKDRISFTDSRKFIDSLSTMQSTLINIRDLLNNTVVSDSEENNRDRVENKLNNNNTSNPLNIFSTSTGSKFDKFIDLGTKIFGVVGGYKFLSYLTSLPDKGISSTYGIQKELGLSIEDSYNAKSVINNMFKDTNLNAANEYARVGTIAKVTGMDDINRISLKYTKAIAEGVEAMSLDTSELADTLYTIEKRGTFTSAQLENVVDMMYKYSKASGEITPEELQKVLKESLDGLIYGKNMTNEQYNKQLKETTSVSSSMLHQGFSADFVAQGSKILNDLMLKGVTSQYYSSLSQLEGTSGEDIMKELNSDNPNYAGALQKLFKGMSDTAKKYGDTTTAEDVRRMNELGFSYNNQTRRLLQKYDPNIKDALDIEAAKQGSIADKAKEGMNKPVVETILNDISNKLQPISDAFAKKGIGASEIGYATGAASTIYTGSKILPSIFGKIKNLFNGSKGASYTTEEVAKALGTTTEDITKTIGKNTSYTAEGLAKSLGTSTDDITSIMGESSAKTAGTIEEGLSKSAGTIVDSMEKGGTELSKATDSAVSVAGKAGKVLGVVGAALQIILTGMKVKDDLTKGDTKGAVKDTLGGAGEFGGAVAGASIGAGIGAGFGGIGAIPGAIIGGLIGGFGGKTVGEGVGSGLYDIFSSNPKTNSNNNNSIIPQYPVNTEFTNKTTDTSSSGIFDSIKNLFSNDDKKLTSDVKPIQTTSLNNPVDSNLILSNLNNSSNKEVIDILKGINTTLLDFMKLIENNKDKDEMNGRLKESRFSIAGDGLGLKGFSNLLGIASNP
jgi:hypothetical protein